MRFFVDNITTSVRRRRREINVPVRVRHSHRTRAEENKILELGENRYNKKECCRNMESTVKYLVRHLSNARYRTVRYSSVQYSTLPVKEHFLLE